MRRILVLFCAVAFVSLFVAHAIAATESGEMKSVTGKVTAVDPQGKGIVVMVNIGGKAPLDVGAIVNADTVVKVAGKKAELSDIKDGDTVRLRYLQSDDLYAKEIVKR
jgi:Cu/Ag efflux protein CusF